MKSPFEFYEVVKLRNASSIPSELVGREGVILGMSSDENGKWYYSVDIEGVEGNRTCGEDDLESTGEFRRREDFYSGETLKVSVDPETGEGKIVQSKRKWVRAD
jgi:hypothetical protein